MPHNIRHCCVLMPLDTVVNAFWLSVNLVFMHIAVKFTTRRRPFKRWPAGTTFATGHIFPPKTPWIYLITINVRWLATRALFTRRFGRPPCWKMHDYVFMHQASPPWLFLVPCPNYPEYSLKSVHSFSHETNRQADRQTDLRTGEQADRARQTNR